MKTDVKVQGIGENVAGVVSGGCRAEGGRDGAAVLRQWRGGGVRTAGERSAGRNWWRDGCTDAIALGLLPDSEQLPGEADLAGIFGVSTTTIREALSSFRLRGLIHTRRGRGGGSFVKRAGGDVHCDRPGPAGGAEPRATARPRRPLQRDRRDGSPTARPSARHADDVQRLVAVCDGLEKRRGSGGRRRADAQFHIEVAATAQSTRLYRAEVSLQAEVARCSGSRSATTRATGRTVQSCRTVVAAIDRTDRDAARAAAEERVADSTARLIDLRLALED